jgi:rSAM/selenodomain-associated transferase 1
MQHAHPKTLLTHRRAGIAVMAKAPVAGRCKTRLVPILTPDQAAAMSAAFLGDMLANLALAARTSPITAYVAYAPGGAEAAFGGIVPVGTHMLLADGDIEAPDGVTGFGRCLLHAVCSLLAMGHPSACVLNSDSPNLPTRLLRAAEMILAAEGDRVVLGPAEDGGYYLLGMKRAHAHLFAHIDWSSQKVAAQTRQRAADIGLEVVELDTWYDVDEPANFFRLLTELEEPATPDAFAAPRSAAIAQRLGLFRRATAFAGSMPPPYFPDAAPAGAPP